LLCRRTISQPRPVYPGATLFVTRRIHKRQLLLRPDPRLNQLLEYILAVLTERYGILMHAVCVMSNHWHSVISDPLGTIVEFERDAHALIARALNAMHGEGESLWAREPSCRLTCLEPDDVLDKIVYTLANPVEAGLVAYGKSWPGLRRSWPDRPRTIKRPEGFFRDEEAGGEWPEYATLTLHRPPGFDHLPDEELAAMLRDQLDKREAALREAAQKAGKRFLGRRAVLRQSRKAYPVSFEERFRARPKVAGRSRWARLERRRQDRAWLAAYQEARERLRAGEPRVCFPYGTWKLRIYYHVPCDDPPVPLRPAA
jgi:putative transposase